MGSKIAERRIGSNGKSIPVIGFGTAESPFGASSETLKDTIVHAIRVGYRHFDTAAVYKSEKQLGEAISEALGLHLIKSRDELFITSKLSVNEAHHHLVLPAIQKSLKNLRLEYLDLYLIHVPISLKPEADELTFTKEDLLPMDFKSVWEAMEECQKLGLTKSIGVSNFSPKKLDIILATANIPPAVNQVEMNPCWQQKKLREYCKEKGIHVSAYSPLGGRGTLWGTSLVMETDLLNQIAYSKGKTTAQVCIRWAYQQEVSIIIKSFNT